ncbi:c-type cytochrome [Pedobacter sp. HMF7647]|uniref:C-type cytochrome n=1 Tax=Hufsiella arboris TaxID=2695275 RepID=A0A7K1Y4D9_9SPHI|nr:c-type cytochrome [Hufsiella arboris]MXV49442.1 c-type cytochrome [Hufsiella arboris]
MKKLFVIAGFCMVVWACNNNSSEQSSGTDSSYSQDQSAKSQQSDADTTANNIGTDRHEDAGVTSSGSEAGKALIEKSDCLTCHREHDKLVGPAYADVAKKYTNNEDNIGLLAKKIIEGGKGVWGEVPMTAHPQVSEADAKEMVRYVLSIK